MNHPKLNGFKEVLETDFALFYLNSLQDTLVVKYRESTEITLEIAKEALSVITPFKENGSKYAIIDFSAQFLSITKEAKKHFKDNVSPHNTNLVAIIVLDTMLKIIANFYARFDKPRVPTRVFNDVNEALEWIVENKV